MHVKQFLSPFCFTILLNLNSFFQFQKPDNDYDYVYYGFPGDEEILHLSESHQVSTSSIVIRKNFPETWLWNEITNVRLTILVLYLISSVNECNLVEKKLSISRDRKKNLHPVKCLFPNSPSQNTYKFSSSM